MTTHPSPDGRVSATATFQLTPPLPDDDPIPGNVAAAIRGRLGCGPVIVRRDPHSPGLVGWSAVLDGYSPGTAIARLEHAVRSDLPAHLDYRLVELVVRTVDELERRALTDTWPDLVGIDEACEIIGHHSKDDRTPISRVRYHALARRPDFPQPVRRGVLLRAAVDRWARERLERPVAPAPRRNEDARPSCSECGHRAWSHGEQDGNPPDGAPCHASTGVPNGECGCVTGYRDHMDEIHPYPAL